MKNESYLNKLFNDDCISSLVPLSVLAYTDFAYLIRITNESEEKKDPEQTS